MEKLPPLKTIFFDIGNVLVFFSHEKMFSQLAACSGLPVGSVKELFLQKGLQENIERGALAPEAAYHLLLEKAPSPFSRAEFFSAASEIFSPNEPAWILVRRLKEEGKRLILLSNTNAYHFQYLSSEFPEFSLFDEKVLSHEVQAMKPDPAIYARALSLAHCPPQECFYTDDIPEYVASARNLGIDAQVYTNPEALKGHLEKRGCFSI